MPRVELRNRNVADEPFIQSLRDYAERLVEESCYEATGFASIADELKLSGRKLIDASKELEISESVKKFVDITCDLADNYILAPDDPACETPQGNSLYDAVLAIGESKAYFSKLGLLFGCGYSDFNDMTLISISLGEGQDIEVPDLPTVHLITKTEIAATCHRIKTEVTNEYFLPLASNLDGEVYLNLELFTAVSESVYDITNKHKKDNQHACSKGTYDKLCDLARAPLFEECGGDKDDFTKNYALALIERAALHELHHIKFPELCIGASAEATGYLFELFRGKDTFEALSQLYAPGVFEDKERNASYEMALAYLKKAGYSEASWKNIKPGSREAASIADSIRIRAGDALTLLEKDLDLSSHKSRLGDNYQQLLNRLGEAVMAQNGT